MLNLSHNMRTIFLALMPHGIFLLTCCSDSIFACQSKFAKIPPQLVCVNVLMSLLLGGSPFFSKTCPDTHHYNSLLHLGGLSFFFSVLLVGLTKPGIRYPIKHNFF